MKIAITGHTAGIGKSFARRLSSQGHEILGLSKRTGDNIRNTPKIVKQIIPCDMWINNAQAGYAQVELLYKVWEHWRETPGKMIWIISTIMTTKSAIPDIPGSSKVAIGEYKNQKRALEDAFYQLRDMSKTRLLLIRPGMIDTQGRGGANTDQWVDTICDFYQMTLERDLWIDEISLAHKHDAPKI